MDLDFANADTKRDEAASPRTPVDIAQRLRALRQERGWTLAQTSERTGLSLSALSKIERGELSPTLSSVNKLAAGFEIDVVTLLAAEEAPVQALDGAASTASRTG